MTDISERAAKKGRRAKTEHGEAQRRALVQEAYLLIAEGGFERLRTREVASRAGLNTATLHYYFATKEDLIRGVVERLFEELSRVDASRRGRANTPLEELREEFADLRYQLEKNPRPTSSCTSSLCVRFEMKASATCLQSWTPDGRATSKATFRPACNRGYFAPTWTFPPQ